MKKILALILCYPSLLFAQDSPLVHDPSINHAADQIAFSYQGDIFTAAINGSYVKRLTIHEAYDSKPIWSADDKHLIFSSNRFGQNDVFKISVEGGVPERITYHSASDLATDISTEGQLLIATSRNFVQVEREPEIHAVSSNGGTPTRFLNALGFDAKLSPNGALVAFTRGSCRIEREAYQGPANRDVWVYNIKEDTYYQITSFEGQDLAPFWGSNQRLYFQSARSGVYNIHQVSLKANGDKNGEPTQITQLKNMGLFSFHLSRNGKDAVMIVGDQLSHVNVETKVSTPIKLHIASDYRFDPQVRQTYRNNVQRLALSPDGKYSSLEVRGEVFLNENDPKKNRTVNLTNSPFRDGNALWLNEEILLFTSDRDGAFNIYAVQSSDENEPNMHLSLHRKITQLTKEKEGVIDLVLSPDRKQLAYVVGYGKLIVAHIDEKGKLSNKKTFLDGWDRPTGLAWSPDSKWLAYSKSDLYFNEEVYIQKADNSGKPINVSMHPKADQGPVWSADGTKLGFSSNRNNGDHDVWFVWLKKEDWEKTREDWEEYEPESTKKSAKDKNETASKEETAVDLIQIDIEDIHQRQHQVTAYTGGEYLSAISPDGTTFYYTTGNSGRGNPQVTSDLYKIAWDGTDRVAITKGNSRPRNIILSQKGSYIYYVAGGSLARIKTAGLKKESLPFTAKMIIDYPAETAQIFDEAWQVIRDRFYDPNHHNKDWTALKNTYRPLAMKASTRQDFKAIFNKMLGQINASHMGMSRGDERFEVQRETTGVLGLELKNDTHGLRITKVVPNAAADREVSSLQLGDIIVGVNGETLQPNTNFYRHLSATSNEKISLEILRNGKNQSIVIRPKSSARTDNYNAWVKERKKLTERYSNGRLGYIHIQGMNWTSFEHFERELTAAGLGKEGIVIDVRYNGGGWTTDYLMAVLSVKQHAYTVPRGAAKDLEKEQRSFKQYYPFSERLPLTAWTKPSIALCNQNSYSNAEIFSHAYKELGIGKLVGVPTFGAVISTGSHSLIDGTAVRVPFRGWYVKSSEKNMDFTPAVPDIIVYNAPDDKSKGVDTQLKAAVDELLKDL